MKLYITSDVGKNISGYETIPVKHGAIDLSHISNNSCEEIIFVDGIENIKLENFTDTLQSIFSKMRFGCRLVISAIDLNTLSQYVINGKINMGQYSELIENRSFISDLSEVRDILKSVGMSIEKIIIKDIYYEISARRKKISN